MATVPSASGVPPEVRPWRFLADLDRGVGGEFVGRHDEILRRRTLPDAAGGVVDRAVARAEPAADTDPRSSPGFCPSGMQPRCVHTPIMTSHSGFLTRAESGCGSRRSADVDILRRLDLLRRAVVDEDRLAAPRRRSAAGPTWTGARSTSVVASASVSRAGLRLSINGQIVIAAPTAPSAPAVRIRKSRRVPPSWASSMCECAISAIQNPVVCAAYPPAAAARGKLYA